MIFLRFSRTRQRYVMNHSFPFFSFPSQVPQEVRRKSEHVGKLSTPKRLNPAEVSGYSDQ